MRRALLFALTLLSLPALAEDLQPFSASYTADWKQLPVSGSAERSLKREDDGRWTLNFEASMLVAGLTEESTFRVDNQTLMPLTYRLNRSGLGKGKKVEQDFDWEQKQVIGTDRGDAVRFPLNRGLLDKSTYQIALQQDVAAGKKSVSYQVVDGDEIETYDFRVLGEEVVRTKAGLIDAIEEGPVTVTAGAVERVSTNALFMLISAAPPKASATAMEVAIKEFFTFIADFLAGF